MGLYDIMDEIAARQVTKTETGDNRMPGVVIGIVQSNYAQKCRAGFVWRSPSGMPLQMN